MKLQLGLLTVATCVLGAAAGLSYENLLRHCLNAQDNSTYVSVQYAGLTDIVDYVYGECYPYQLGADLAQKAVFCRSVTCYSNPNPNCTGGAVPPIPVPVPAGLTLVNVADFVQYIGQGATCWPNALPI
ncbi:hypothetical protein HYPSUDRAFT_470652 [Hypholoma sublateritium FD-334 SS-4]|uniref:Uncharacterized protein n=1 Tax=Hypholoma sublateritium (strain FD-334 SS-4) TaxID=945553 RepID=A0A0D2KH51_HYPSF|nr:hypothetical protein HYPSUDRAFT_470652 [Hypholoma sublateritium FD-334 SS-4]